ncbi:acetamidase/formamidase family protein [Marinibaculum pumilum]|uniref:Acetamidase/formamidase family protein n=1 Tax=Marinibaculum pumilum TaxID=1766165 RepID=A0ABV7LA83_9PROT
MHAIRIDRSKGLAEQPGCGHNRYHPDIPPVLEVAEGEEVVLECRDGLDGQITGSTTVDDFPNLDSGRIHPLTGPVFVKGAEPGDALEVEFLEIEAQPYAFSCIMPGLGFLRDVIDTPFLAHWKIADGWATSEQIPGVRIPGAPFMGISATAPSHDKLVEWTDREQRLIDRGGMVFPPDGAGAIPGGGCGLKGLRTLPPREHGGNFDVKQLTKGSKLLLPVYVDGALFSVGDGHFAQGDGEVCVTAVEMGATAAVRFKLHKGLAAKRQHINAPVYSFRQEITQPEPLKTGTVLAAMGMPFTEDGEIDGENLTLAARNALLNMIALLQERGFSREQAYVICSVACDLHVSNVVDVPNYTVSALLPEVIFG